MRIDIIKSYGNIYNGDYIKYVKFHDFIINLRMIKTRLYGIRLRKYNKT